MPQPSPSMGIQARDGVDQFLQLIQDPFNTSLSEKAFWSSLGYSFGAALLFVVLFCILRPHNGTVYAPRLKHVAEEHAPPRVGNGILSWVSPVVKISEAALTEKIGLDANLFLRSIKMCRDLMIVLSVIGSAVYVPVNFFENVRNTNIMNTTNIFILLTPLGVWGTACWAHVIVSYIFDGVLCWFIWRNYGIVTRLRRQYFESPEYQTSLHSRTLLVTDIPPEYQNDSGVSQIVAGIDQAEYGSGVVARNVKGLPGLVKEHDEAVRELESILAKYLKDPDNLPPKRPLCKTQKGDPDYTSVTKVDAIDYLTSRIRRLKENIYEKRKFVHRQQTLSYGFASYQSIEGAHNAAFGAQNKHPQGTTIQLAPKPRDLIWENLSLNHKQRFWRTLMNSIWVIVLTVVWTVPNALIAVFLANLNNLGSVWPTFQAQLLKNPRAWAAIQGILAPGITTLFYLALPVIFRRLAMFAGDSSKTAREQHVTKRLYAFFVFNNLIVFSLFSTAWKYGASVKAAENNVDLWSAIVNSHPFDNLLIAFCDVSPFWLNYLLQRNFGAALDLSQFYKLVTGYISRTLLNPTPRERIELSIPQPFDYAAYYNNFLFYTTIALVFAPFQPLVLLVTALYFILDTITKSYLLLFVFSTKHESGGAFWQLLVNRLLFAALLANVVTTILIIDRRESLNQVYAMIPLPILIAGFKWYCRRTFDDSFYFYSKGLHEPKLEDSQRNLNNDHLGVRFGHPALYNKLMVPMVHEKANRLLKEIIDDQSDVDFGETNEYSDTFQMRRLSARQPGQADAARDATFEIVDEYQLDIEHFRNRDEFSALLGDGEVYGSPSDLPIDSTVAQGQYSRSRSTDSQVEHTGLSGEYDYEGRSYPTGYHPPSIFRPERTAQDSTYHQV
ncbi:hypothetical protein GGS21DRAFT_492217 [Xylaria nigripes]|nr:hypothetical protein GGS21DRAFT_492217 [Xylaria nigripes]